MPYLGADGKVIVLAGQGRAGATVMFDPDWLEETTHETHFADGVDSWSVFKHFGPAKRWWRDRTQGAVLIDHPDTPDAKALHIRRADELPGDGALWNFPMSRKGDLTLHMKLQEGFGGARITLMDRFFNPTDKTCDDEAIIDLDIDAQGSISLREAITIGEWHTVRFRWDLDNRTCAVTIDDTVTVYRKPAYRDPLGINYIRIRSTAETTDTAGLIVESVKVQATP